MLADLVAEDEDPNYRDKVAQCLEWRCKKMRYMQGQDNRKWKKVTSSDKNYIMEK